MHTPLSFTDKLTAVILAVAYFGPMIAISLRLIHLI
jgi:hypothetical protein